MSTGADLPFLSIVIPTHNRREMLAKTIEAVLRQDYPRDRMEVIVALDDCTDGTQSYLQALNPPCQFKSVDLPKSGAGVARNRGMHLSIGEVVVFLDDDMECAPGFLSAHAALHAQSDHLVVQGYCPFPPQIKRNLHVITAIRWWEQHFERLARPGHQLGHQDLYTGNLSVRREHLLAVGGFDEEFGGYGNEDYELGVRLANRGLELRFCRAALAWHHFDTPLSRSLQRTRLEARADIIYGRKHPHLKRTFRLFTLTQERSIPTVASRVLAFWFPWLGDFLAARALKILDGCEFFGLRGTWMEMNWALHRYYYWRGVRDSLGTYSALKEYLADDWGKAPARSRTRITSVDLKEQVPAIEGLDRYRRLYILLKNGSTPVAWSRVENPGGRISGGELTRLIERQALMGVVRNNPGEARLADAVLRPLFVRRSRRPAFHRGTGNRGGPVVEERGWR